MMPSAEEVRELLEYEWETYRISEGETVVGTVKQMTYGSNNYHDQYPIVRLVTDAGAAIELHLLHTVAQEEVTKVDPQPGDILGIKYLGTRTPKKGGASFHAYTVFCSKSGAASPGRGAAGEAGQHEPVPIGENRKAEIQSKLIEFGTALAHQGGVDAVKHGWAERGLPAIARLTDRDMPRVEEYLDVLQTRTGEPF